MKLHNSKSLKSSYKSASNYRQKQRATYNRSKKKAGSGATRRKNIAIRLTIFLVVGLLICVVGIVIWLQMFGAGISKPTLPALVQLEVTSSPTGATIRLDDQAKGVTPARLPVSAGHHTLEFRKSGYSNYFTEVELEPNGSTTTLQTALSTSGSTLPSRISVSKGADRSVTLQSKAGVSFSPTISASLPFTTTTLPTYSFSVELWPDKVIMQPLPKPLPDARLEMARYLNSQTLELTYLTAEGGLLPPGTEGLPTNLWLYRPTTADQSPYPIVLTYPLLQTIGRYHGLDNPGTGPNTSGTILTNLAVSGSVVSPEAHRIAFVSNSLVKSSSNQFGSTGATSTSNKPAVPPSWDDQAIWLSSLSAKPSPGGAILAGSDEASNQPLRLFSLKDLSSLLPGLTFPTAGISSSLGSQRFATIQQLSWSRAGDKLLAVIELNEAALSGGRLSSGSGTVTILALIPVRAERDAAASQTNIVTPQPLTEEVLPGTIGWSADDKAVSFLVTQNTQSSGNTPKAGLCVLDLSYNSNSINRPTPQSQNPSRTPLSYVGQVSSAGVWNTNSRSNNYFTSLSGGRVYPPAYGSIRYNPFSWKELSPLASSPSSTTQPLSESGFYSAAASDGGSYNRQQYTVANLYAYELTQDLSRPIPFVTITPSSSGSKLLTPGPTLRPGELPAQVKTGSYPYWPSGSTSPLYLAVRPTVVSNDGSKKSSGGGLLGGGSSGGVSWQLGVETFALPPELTAQNKRNAEGITTIAPGLTFRKLSERRDQTALVLPTTGVSSEAGVSGLLPGKLEAQWQPDGKGVLIALPAPAGQSNSSNNVWLAEWN